jgi:hypothetical protein
VLAFAQDALASEARRVQVVMHREFARGEEPVPMGAGVAVALGLSADGFVGPPGSAPVLGSRGGTRRRSSSSPTQGRMILAFLEDGTLALHDGTPRRAAVDQPATGP